MALGIMLSVVFVLAATLTLLPAVLAKLGPRVDKLALPLGALRRAPLAARSPPGASGSGATRIVFGPAALVVLRRCSRCPVLGLKTGMPSIKVVPDGDTSRSRLRRRSSRRSAPGAPGALQIVAPRRRRAPRPPRSRRRDPGIARRHARRSAGGGGARADRRPSRTPTRPSPAVGATIDRLRADAPGRGARRRRGRREPRPRAGARREDPARDRRRARARLPAAARRAAGAADRRRSASLTNLLATGAAFGVARLIFQDGHGAGLLGFEPQGFLDAWGPVFFFAMIFAISMDYTVFLLASAKEHYDRIRRPAGGHGRRRSPTPAG